MNVLTLNDGRYFVLAQSGDRDSHTLGRKQEGGWLYGERTCFSDTCQCVTHAPWQYQDATEDEAAQILALFQEKGHAVRIA